MTLWRANEMALNPPYGLPLYGEILVGWKL